MKIISILTLLIFTSAAFAAAPAPGKVSKLGDILRNTDGSIRYMTSFEAERACPTGSHLPTTREIAEIAQSLGASGILEMSQVNPPIPAKYYPVSAYNLVNNRWIEDSFYYNRTGYKSPWGDTEDFYLWTSSLEKDLSTRTGGPVTHYAFGQRFGFFYTIFSIYDTRPVVRCISN